jgi:hypothetical protein
VSFRHPDPAIAAKFLNELANALIATQGDLVQIPGADVFFQQQTNDGAEAEERARSSIFRSRPRFIPLKISASCFSSGLTHLVR